jgi:membrane protease YdiL (CAAX protease family)
MIGRLQRFVPERIGLGLSVLLFGLPALALWIVTSVLVPNLVTRGWEPLAAWFVAGMLVLGPLLVFALVGAWISQPVPAVAGILKQLRVHRMTVSDWRVAALALVIAIAAVAALQVLNTRIWPRLPPHPPFLTVQPLVPAQYYLLALWLPFFAVNIIGEELWWRGFIQPRQEPIFGSGTWIVQGLLHFAFHFSFGLGVMFVLWPVVFSIPWAVQRTRNTSVGMVVHAGINGPGFLAVTLGLSP